MVDVLILNYVDYETTEKLVNSVRNYKNVARVCVVDNASPNNSYEWLKQNYGDIVDVIKTPKNGGYGYGNNYGIKYLYENYESKYILLCNPDVIIADDVIGQLEDFLKHNDSYIIAAPFMLDRNGIKQKNTAFKIDNMLKYIMSFGMLYSKIFRPGEYRYLSETTCDIIDVEAVAGSLFMFDVAKMINNAMYDENVFLYCEERILGMKCRNANLKIALLPKYTFIHNHSVSINKTIASEVKKRKVMNKSAMYVIKKYYNANFLGILLGKIMMSISIGEIRILEILKRKRHKG